jgi:hypothetical protein
MAITRPILGILVDDPVVPVSLVIRVSLVIPVSLVVPVSLAVRDVVLTIRHTIENPRSPHRQSTN